MVSHLNDRKYWCDLAKELRALAEHLKDADAKTMILGRAHDYPCLEPKQLRFPRRLMRQRYRGTSTWGYPHPTTMVHYRLQEPVATQKRTQTVFVCDAAMRATTFKSFPRHTRIATNGKPRPQRCCWSSNVVATHSCLHRYDARPHGRFRNPEIPFCMAHPRFVDGSPARTDTAVSIVCSDIVLVSTFAQNG
jgi:hypothetical protein